MEVTLYSGMDFNTGYDVVEYESGTRFLYREVVSFSRDALSTAFVIEYLLVVLPLLTERIKALIRHRQLSRLSINEMRT